jgi:YD repeat-containing protein
VVKTRAAARSPALARLRLATSGTQPTNGSLFRIGAPMMWDATPPSSLSLPGGDATASDADGPGTGGPALYWQSWTLDAAGNRRSQTGHSAAGDAATTYSYPAAGTSQPHTLTGTTTNDPTGTSTARYSYDPAGATTSRPGEHGQQTLTWDQEGRLGTLTDTTGASSPRRHRPVAARPRPPLSNLRQSWSRHVANREADHPTAAAGLAPVLRAAVYAGARPASGLLTAVAAVRVWRPRRTWMWTGPSCPRRRCRTR